MQGNELFQLLNNGIVIDLETTLNHDPEIAGGTKFKGSPHSTANKIVAIGARKVNILNERNYGYLQGYGVEPNVLHSVISFLYDTVMNKPTLLIGHNIAFDIQYYLNYIEPHCVYKDLQKFISNLHIWDTMLAEFYLSRQASISPSLELACANNDIEFAKDETVTESFKAGIGSDKIDPDLLSNYLEEDVNSTRNLFHKQHLLAAQRGGPGYVQYLIDIMGARLCTLQMEMNGLKLDKEVLQKEGALIEADYETLKLDLNGRIAAHLPALPLDTVLKTKINCESPSQIKTLLFGGAFQCSKEVTALDNRGNEVLFKTGPKAGTVKTKKIAGSVSMKGLLWNIPIPNEFENTTGEKNLKDLHLYLKAAGYHKQAGVIDEILRLRKLAKELHTYYEGFEEHLWKHDNCLRPSYNHAIAKTKRLTSSNPNMQNVSNKIVESEEE